MRRFKQQVSEEACIEVLKNTKRGVLSVIGDDGYPYGMPINHYYSQEDGKLYFHGAKAGHKIDAIKACDSKGVETISTRLWFQIQPEWREDFETYHWFTLGR